VLIFPLAVSQANPETVIMDHDCDVVGLVE
jgi:hypothetical protein